MWNFNSGTQLRQYMHREEHVEYSALLFVHDEDRQSSQVCPAQQLEQAITQTNLRTLHVLSIHALNVCLHLCCVAHQHAEYQSRNKYKKKKQPNS